MKVRRAHRWSGAACRGSGSEFIANQLGPAYSTIFSGSIVADPTTNVTFHQKLVGDLREGFAKGSISIADPATGGRRSRRQAAVDRAQEDLANAAC